MVMKSMLFDTCFLIDIEREMRRGPSGAHAFLSDHRSARACITWTVAGEFAEGFADIHDPACATMLARFEILPMNLATAAAYARITAQLRREKRLIGTNDLWIAAAALAYDMELVTRNADHFKRVPGIAVTVY